MSIHDILWRIAIIVTSWITTEVLTALKKWLKGHFGHKKK